MSISRVGGVVLILFTACVSNKNFDEIINDIKEQEITRIASINEQITAINSSLSTLSSTDASLKSLIDDLELAKEALSAAVQDNDSKIDSVKKELEQDASSTKQELLDQLNTLQAELQGKLDAINLVLDDLKEKDAELEEQIKTLSNYVNTELKNTKDWAQATFSTLEQYNATVEEIAGIKADIDAVNKSIKELETRIDEKIAADIAEAVSALDGKIQKLSDDVYAKIAESVEDLKKWVNTQLTSYYTIAEIDEKVKVLEKAIKDGDDASAAEINKLKEELKDQKTTITEAYKAAIAEAISTNNGIIDGKIQEAVDGVNGRIDTEVAAITEQLTTVFSRLDGIDASLLEIYGLLKKVYPTSIVIISESNVKMGFGKTRTIDFRVNPSEASFNYDLTSDDCEIELDYLGENVNTKAGYVTTPSHITLTKVEQMYDANLNKLKGQYRAYITDQRVQRKYNDRLGLVLTVPGNNGNDFQITSSAINVALSVGEIISFTFKESDNPKVLQETLVCDVEDDAIYGRIPHLTDGKTLVPSIVFEGEGELVLHSAPDQDINAATDYSRPVVYDVIDEGTNEIVGSYEVNISSFTGLPVMNIWTENAAPIVSKEDYLSAKFEIKDCVTGEFDFSLSDVEIKGRGNSTWDMPKKPYKLKFNKKTQLFGESNNKHWVLLANYSDKSFIRTSTAFYMGELSNLDWTPCTHFVELFINDKYQGTYQLTEQIKIAKDRVNVTDDGYILEVDVISRMTSEDVYFNTDRILLNIKEPEVEWDSERYNWIKNYVTNAENALYGENFLDPETGYKAYIDMASFVEWYMVNEITHNNDALFFSSCYMNIAPGGKLKMGPLWDFDISLGNNDYNGSQEAEGLWIYYSKWINRMFDDPEFVTAVRDRFNYYKSHLDEIYSHINSDATYLKYSMVENNNKWETFYKYTWPNYAVWGAYQNEVENMKQFITKRMAWLDENLPS